MTIHNHKACREIVTKAVCGKGRKFALVSHTITPPCSPTSILGAWIINHRHEAIRSGDHVEITGEYDVNIWYSHDHNSKTDVAKETIAYVESVPLTYIDHKHKAVTSEVIAEATQVPNCVEACISANGRSVLLRVEREFEVEMIAETKVCIVVCPGGCNDEFDKEFDFHSSQDDDESFDEELDDVLLNEEYT
jgi:spore coat protein E